MNFNRHSRPIPNFDKYRVTDDGRVFNSNNHELRQAINRGGYSMVTLCKNGKNKNCSVHRLVAQAFIPNPNMKRTVNHKDGDKTNNNVSNLEWATHSENERHAYSAGLRKSYLTDEHRKNGATISGKKSRRAVRVIETGKEYLSAKECAKDTGCDCGAISKCCNGLAKQHRGYHFEFINDGGTPNAV